MYCTSILARTLLICLIVAVERAPASERERLFPPAFNGPLQVASAAAVDAPSDQSGLEPEVEMTLSTLLPAAEEQIVELTEAAKPENSTGPENSAEPEESTEQDEAEGSNLAKPPKDEPKSKTDATTENEATAGSEPPTPTVPPQPKLSPRMLQLRAKVRRCLGFYLTRQLNTRDDSPWSIMHALIGFGVDTRIRVGGPRGREVNAISWLCGNGTCSGVKLLHLRNGQLGVTLGDGFQGHEGQLLGMLAQSRVMIDYPIIVSGKRLSVADLVKYEQLNCRPKSELTFRLIGLSHYLDSDETWKDKHGRSWDIPRLIREELAQPINGVTCGGTHRLMGFSYSVRKRERSGRPVTGQWLRAQKYVNDYHRYTFRLQNRDGSFSTAYFRHRENRSDIKRRLETSGHILEWLVFSLPAEKLKEPQTIRAVEYLADLMYKYRNTKLPVGPLGHAIRSLVLYEERVFGVGPGQRNLRLVKSHARGRDR